MKCSAAGLSEVARSQTEVLGSKDESESGPVRPFLKWPGGKRWKHRDIYKPDWRTAILGNSFMPQRTPLTEADLIRSQRDLESPSLGEFIANW